MENCNVNSAWVELVQLQIELSEIYEISQFLSIQFWCKKKKKKREQIWIGTYLINCDHSVIFSLFFYLFW